MSCISGHCETSILTHMKATNTIYLMTVIITTMDPCPFEAEIAIAQ
jgi:hypothetical protein